MSNHLSALVRHMTEDSIKAPQKTNWLANKIIAFCLSAALPQSVCHPTCAVVFSDIVCTSLEYFSKFRDVTIWEFPNKVGLEHKVHSAGGLNGRVFGTGGHNWSAAVGVIGSCYPLQPAHPVLGGSYL